MAGGRGHSVAAGSGATKEEVSPHLGGDVKIKIVEGHSNLVCNFSACLAQGVGVRFYIAVRAIAHRLFNTLPDIIINFHSLSWIWSKSHSGFMLRSITQRQQYLIHSI